MITLKFQYEDLCVVMAMVRLGNYMATIDFTNGFHNVAVHLSSRTILGFKLNNMTSMNNVLPFILVASL